MPDINQLNPADYSLEIIEDEDTGKVYRSTGSRWIELEQGPTKMQQAARGGMSALAAGLPSLLLGPGVGVAKNLGSLATRIALKRAGESILPMAAETAMQKSGLAPESGTDIALSGMVSPLVRSGPSVAKSALRGGATIVAPQQAREAGETLAIKMASRGKPLTGFAKISEQAPVPITPVVGLIDNAISRELAKSNPAAPAVKWLKNLREKYVPGGVHFVRSQPSQQNVIKYGDLAGEMQDLRAQALSLMGTKKGKRAAASLFQARKAILDEMGKVDPLIKKANESFKKQESIKTLADALRKSNPLNSVKALFQSDPLVSSAFTATQKDDILKVAASIARVPTGINIGVGNKFMMGFTEPIAEALSGPVGQSMLSVLMKNPPRPESLGRLLAVIGAEGTRSGLDITRVGAQGNATSPQSPR